MWTVITTDLFNEWLEQQDESTQEKVLAALVVLQQQGPSLGRPLVDTVYDSKFTNMKELHVQHRGKPQRAFFAFDPFRQAIVLCIGNKVGKKRFYKEMLDIAEQHTNFISQPLEINPMAKTLQELLANRSPESQTRIQQQMADELLLEIQLHLIREELEISQKELAATLGIKQPSLSAIENRGNDLKISTMKKYVEAMGGKLRIDVELPTGKYIGFNV
jgi:DNA-binding XRE family transcriptional regulator